MEQILQEITAVGCRTEGLDTTISALADDTKSLRQDIMAFQNTVTGLEQRVTIVEDHLNMMPDSGQERLSLCGKVTDLEDRSRRNNAHFFRFSGYLEETSVATFLRKSLPEITGLTFDPSLEFQRAHCMGPKRPEGVTRPRPIIVCFI
ncbi:hypothetical protein NDU88_000932 [Pleurodeles waltl]|uniref:Uncharacterized protein n=1 Tax=Pleurodeles waltl TaxID=8319 RepID=A0AAV7WMS7_PLEWA|nr:hypothetical protein NDU88_000932 [Pleurodeles waltl]